MDIRTALRDVNYGDLGDDDLLRLAMQIQEERDFWSGHYRRVEYEVGQRLNELGASILMGGDVSCERAIVKSYSWNGEAVAEVAPDLCKYVPAETVTVPGHYVVANTVKVNNMITKLGDSPAGRKLEAARMVEEKPGKLSFTRRESPDPDKAERVAALVARVESGA